MNAQLFGDWAFSLGGGRPLFEQPNFDTETLCCIAEVACDRGQYFFVIPNHGCVKAVIAIEHRPYGVISRARNANIEFDGVGPAMLHKPGDTPGMGVWVLRVGNRHRFWQKLFSRERCLHVLLGQQQATLPWRAFNRVGKIQQAANRKRIGHSG